MSVRMIALAVVALGFAGIAAGNDFRGAKTAFAQEADAGLAAAVEALQTQVAEQDDRITELEEEVGDLQSAVAHLVAQLAPEERSVPPTTQPEQDAYTITGSLTLLDGGATSVVDQNFAHVVYAGRDYCHGQAGYRGIEGEMQVVITNASGQTIATGRTEEGEYQELQNACEFAFTVDDVPLSDFYAISIGRLKGPTYTFEELEANNWRIDVSVG
jgi:hypothetical protein